MRICREDAMLHNEREFTVDITGGSVPVISFGKGKKTMVMIPGLRLSDIKGTARAVAGYYRIFSDEYTVYLIDRKTPLKKDCTIRDLAEDTEEVMKELQLQEVYLFGVSQGGMIAQELAIQHPERIRRMVLGVTLSRMNRTSETVIRHWIDLAETSGLPAVAEDYMEKGFSEEYVKKYKAFLPLAVKMQRLMAPDRFCDLARTCLTCNTYDDLGRISCPVLVLGGSQDKIVTGEASREIAEKLNCEYYLYDGLGHEAYNEAKDFNRRIYDFFSEVEND